MEMVVTDVSLAPLQVANGPRPVTEDESSLARRMHAPDATDDEWKLYLHDCRSRGVHPLDRLILFSKRSTKKGDKYTPITSIDYMRTRAHATGACAGISDPVFVGDQGSSEFAATVTVKRIVQNMVCDFTATARWTEYFPGEPGGFMWKRMPYTMLGKCAEALALRKGFPQELAGLYAREEMDQAEQLGDRPLGTEKPIPPGNRYSKPVVPQKRSLIGDAEPVTAAVQEFNQARAMLAPDLIGELLAKKICDYLKRDIKHQSELSAEDWRICTRELRIEFTPI